MYLVLIVYSLQSTVNRYHSSFLTNLQKCRKPSAEPSSLELCRGAAHFRNCKAIAKL